MAIFDIEKDDLLRLSDSKLEELVARLAEAEVAAHGHSPAWVRWAGSINASDEGVDIHVQVPADTLRSGFLERPETILQAKKHSMPTSSIKKEMLADGELSATISELTLKGGSYIIVSLKDDCSPRMRKQRLKAMQDAVKDDPGSANIHLDFYDRSKLRQWLRQHPSVMLWAKGKLGQGYSGWRPYEAWSNPPQGAVDKLITVPGVTVTLPSGKGQKLSIQDAIDPMREIIRSTTKAVRVTGLSGVGKTRIVQALFDETVGTDALDRTVAVYVDTGAEPDPSATAMLDRLIAEGRRAVMILDNCPSELHSSLASKVSGADAAVTLITVEYDIRDDKPQTSEVIHIEAVGPEVAEKLLIRRFPSIGQNNARRIAAFADGNARVSLAIAERVIEGESLAKLSDSQLFDRLFEQRNNPDDDLREQAELLSIVYSFSVSNPEAGRNELGVLGSISGYSQSQLFRSVKKLLDRHIVQKRGHWRAVLPQAIANRLAVSALDSIPVDKLRATFETSGRERLLMSFAHRLGMLHDHPVAKEIVEAWLQPDGLLGRISALNDTGARMLTYVGPVAPEALLERIEAELSESDFEEMEPRYNPRRVVIVDLLVSLAYEPSAFARCVRLLIHLAENEDESNNYDAVQTKVTRFFRPYLSGTHASLEQRLSVMKECLASEVAGRRSLGYKMLSIGLDGPPSTGFAMSEFGARPRDFGSHPSHDELVRWRSAFIDVAVLFGTSGDPELEAPARLILANQFRRIWHQRATRSKLFDASRKLNAHKPWGEGWKAIRSMIHFDYSRRKGEKDREQLPETLAALESHLEPKELIPAIMTYVLSAGADYWALDSELSHDDTNTYSQAANRLETKALKLGEEFAASAHAIGELGLNLFSSDYMPYGAAFGRGLAAGVHDLRVAWRELIDQVEQQPGANKNFAIIGGFIEMTSTVDPSPAQEFLDQCVQNPELRRVLVGLHPRRNFTEKDLDRCIAILDDPDIDPRMFGTILWQDEYSDLPESRLLELTERLLTKPNGEEVVLDALWMKLHGKDNASDTLGPDLRRVGLNAATKRLQRDHGDPGGSIGHHMNEVVGAALRCDGNEPDKIQWIDAIFGVVDEHYGCIHGFEEVIETTAEWMPNEFLNRAFEGTDEEKSRRLFFIQYGGLRRPILSKVDADIMIQWCRARDEDSHWASVATGISLWVHDGDQEIMIITKPAIKLLEESPDPRAILEEYAARVTPLSCSDGLVNVIEGRADAISALAEHERADIASAAKALSEKLRKWVERQRVCKQHQDEEREQRFE